MISIYCNTQVPKAMTLMCHTEKEESAMKRHAKGIFSCLSLPFLSPGVV